MIQKIHTLQRKLIQKTEEVLVRYTFILATTLSPPIHTQVVEKELLIQEKEKLYMELKAILQRQPGPEVAEQLQIYQQTLKEKTKQMKVIHIYSHVHVHNPNAKLKPFFFSPSLPPSLSLSLFLSFSLSSVLSPAFLPLSSRAWLQS